MKLYHFDSVTSTNDIAKELLEKEDSVVVYADMQTQGRGRNEKFWYGNKGENLYCSIGFTYPEKPNSVQIAITQAVGALAAKNAILKITSGNNFRIKYPNDIIAILENGSYGKVCGVLAEHQFQGDYCRQSIIGIGINVNQIQFSKVIDNYPVSLKMLGYKTKPKAILDELLVSFNSLMKNDPYDILALWSSELKLENKEISIKSIKNESFKFSDLQPDGRLLLISNKTGKLKRVDNGDSIRYDFQ